MEEQREPKKEQTNIPEPDELDEFDRHTCDRCGAITDAGLTLVDGEQVCHECLGDSASG